MTNRLVLQNFHHSAKHKRFAAAFIFSVMLAVACSKLLVPHSYADSASILYISPSGSGSNCSNTSPCNLTTALSLSTDGGTVYLSQGVYSDQIIHGDTSKFKGFSKQVILTPMPGANVVTTGWDIRLSHIMLKNIISNGGASYVRLGSDFVTFDGYTASGPAKSRYVAIRANNVTIRNSRFKNNIHDLVAMGEYTATGQPIKNIVIENSTFGPAAVADTGVAYSGSTMDHVDCLQLFGGTDGVTIRNNTFYGCANSEIIIKGDRNSSNKNVLVENNFMQACIKSSYSCGYYVLYVRNGIFTNENVIIRNNTIDGSMSIDRDMPEFKAIGNIIANFSGMPYGNCDGLGLSYNVIANSACDVKKTLPPTNVIGAARFINPQAVDYHLASSDTVALDYGVHESSITDIDGQYRDSKPDAGADEYVSPSRTTTGSPASAPGSELINRSAPLLTDPDAELLVDPAPVADGEAVSEVASSDSRTAPSGNGTTLLKSSLSSGSINRSDVGKPKAVTDTNDKSLADYDVYKELKQRISLIANRVKEPALRIGAAIFTAASVALIILWVLHIKHFYQYSKYVTFTNGNARK